MDGQNFDIELFDKDTNEVIFKGITTTGEHTESNKDIEDTK